MNLVSVIFVVMRYLPLLHRVLNIGQYFTPWMALSGGLDPQVAYVSFTVVLCNPEDDDFSGAPFSREWIRLWLPDRTPPSAVRLDSLILSLSRSSESTVLMISMRSVLCIPRVCLSQQEYSGGSGGSHFGNGPCRVERSV